MSVRLLGPRGWSRVGSHQTTHFHSGIVGSRLSLERANFVYKSHRFPAKSPKFGALRGSKILVGMGRLARLRLLAASRPAWGGLLCYTRPQRPTRGAHRFCPRPLLFFFACPALRSHPSAGSVLARSPPRAGPPPFRRLRILDCRPLLGRRRPTHRPILAGKGLSFATSFCSFISLSGALDRSVERWQ